MFPCDYIGVGGYLLREHDFDGVCYSICKYGTDSNLSNIDGCLAVICKMANLCCYVSYG